MEMLSLLPVISNLLFYIGALLAAGTVAYLLLFETGAAKPLYDGKFMARLFAVIGLAAALAGYALAGANLTGEMAGAVDPEMLALLLQTRIGTAFFSRVGGFTLIITGSLLGRTCKPVMAIGSLVALGSFTQIGHVSDMPGALYRILLLIHVTGIAVWVGILPPLYRLSARPSRIAPAAEIAHAFGRMAAYFVPILLIAGGWLAYRLLISPENLLATGYGRTLLIKILLAAILLGLAAINKLRLVPALKAGDAAALKHLHRSVSAEMILVIFILCASAMLTGIFPLPGG